MRLRYQFGLVAVSLLLLPWFGFQIIYKLDNQFKLSYLESQLNHNQTLVKAIKEDALAIISQGSPKTSPIKPASSQWLHNQQSLTARRHARLISPAPTATTSWQTFTLYAERATLPIKTQQHYQLHLFPHHIEVVLKQQNANPITALQFSLRYPTGEEEHFRTKFVNGRWQAQRENTQGQWQATPFVLVEHNTALSQLNIRLPIASKIHQLSLSLSRFHNWYSGYKWLNTRNPALSQLLETLQPEDSTLAIIDLNGRILGSSSEAQATQQTPPSISQWLLDVILQDPIRIPSITQTPNPLTAKTSPFHVNNSLTSVHLYRQHGLPVSVATSPLSDNTPYFLTHTHYAHDLNHASHQGLTLWLWGGLGSFALLVAITLGFASWLSYRIIQINRFTRQAAKNPKALPITHSRWQMNDEIKTLNDTIIHLFRQVNQYTQYLNDLSNKLSHEIRTPVAIIRSSLDNLKSVAPNDEEIQRYCDRALLGSARLSEILTRLSQASQLESAIAQAGFQTVSLPRFLQDACDIYQSTYAHLVFSFTPPPQPFEVNAAPELLMQLLDKVIENSASFCLPRGEVSLHLTGDNTRWQLTISNDGPLIDPSILENMFDSMVSKRRHSEQIHLGLGLHICKLICQHHKGQIRASNASNAKGARFTLVCASHPENTSDRVDFFHNNG